MVDLLNRHAQKPEERAIARFVATSEVVDQWFLTSRATAPRLSLVVMSDPVRSTVNNDEAIALPTLGHVADWLELEHHDLDWLCALRREQATHYHYVCLPKRHGGSRLIECPKRLLRETQRLIYRNITSRAHVHEAATAFRPGASCLVHAARHHGQAFVFSLDISDFFQSIGWRAVFRLFRGLGYRRRIAQVLSALCTHRVDVAALDGMDLPSKLRAKLVQRHLPQGAPTSPSISNVICLQLDRRLTGLALRNGMNYSRYADDMVFSGNRPRDWTSLEALIGAICIEEGFELNHRKTRLRTQSQQQRITGIVVNQKTNIDRRVYDALKAELHNCASRGVAGQNRLGIEHYRSHLRGRIGYLRLLNPHRGDKLMQIFNRIDFDE